MRNSVVPVIHNPAADNTLVSLRDNQGIFIFRQ